MATARTTPTQAAIRAIFEASAKAKDVFLAECSAELERAIELIAGALRDGKKLLLFGNGGSAADCQHLAAEFVSRFSKDLDRRALPAISLTTDTSFLTGFGNDCGFEGIFERQVEALGSPGDILIAISTSGNSPNVIRAVEAARKRNMGTIALTGNGGRLGTMADIVIAVPSADTQYIQEVHLAVEHIVCELVEFALFREPRLLLEKQR